MTAKIDWYKEVLELEPGSKVFFPLARLLAQAGKPQDAMKTLAHGLDRHPEYLEARLFLIELLYKNGESAQCREQVDELSRMFASYAGFWEAWAACLANEPGEDDTASILRFLAVNFVAGPLKLHEVLNRGLDVLLKEQQQAGTEPQVPVSADDELSARELPSPEETDASCPEPADLPAPDAAEALQPAEPEAEPAAEDSPLDEEMAVAPDIAASGETVVEPSDDEVADCQPESVEDSPEPAPENQEAEEPATTDEPAGLLSVQAGEQDAVPGEDMDLELSGASPEKDEVPLPEDILPSSILTEAEEAELALPPEDPESPSSLPVVEDATAPDTQPESSAEDQGTEVAAQQVPENDVPDILPDDVQATGKTIDDFDLSGAMDAILPDEEILPQQEPQAVEPDEELPLPEIEDHDLPVPDLEAFRVEPPAAPSRPPLEDQESEDEPLQVAEAAATPADAPEEPDALADVEAAMDSGATEAQEGAMPPVDASPEADDGENMPSEQQARPNCEEEGSEEQFSLRTRSMAEVLAEQGDIQGALDIYNELSAAAPTPEEAEDINHRMATLRARLGAPRATAEFDADEAARRSKDKLVSMLEALAQRVEARAQD